MPKNKHSHIPENYCSITGKDTYAYRSYYTDDYVEYLESEIVRLENELSKKSKAGRKKKNKEA